MDEQAKLESPLAVAGVARLEQKMATAWSTKTYLRSRARPSLPLIATSRRVSRSSQRRPLAVIGAVARLYPVKGLAIVLHAVARLRALRPSLDKLDPDQVRNSVLERFTHRHMAAEYQRLYSALIGGA